MRIKKRAQGEKKAINTPRARKAKLETSPLSWRWRRL